MNREGGAEGNAAEPPGVLMDAESAPLEPPIASEPALTPEEEAEGFGALDADEGEQEDLAQQQREETV